ncbi:MAG: STAS domain-containing protein [Polyangiales bacterium]
MQVRHDADRTTLLIRGPVRLGEVPDLLEHARAASARGMAVELDLSEAEHLHTAAWQVLMALEQDLQTKGLSLSAHHASEQTQNMLEFLELASWLGAAQARGEG